MFNYEGGVGKTTFAANLGTAFALSANKTPPGWSMGPELKFMMIDANPHSILTSFYLPVAPTNRQTKRCKNPFYL